jgi:2-hydroxyacyl-CoA lyase 1
MRHEQSASYAAGAVGYLTGRPGVCLTVSGPGMTNAISGLGNARANCWPMIHLAGANDSYQMGMGAFQEAPQLEAARPFTKYAARVESTARLPFYVEQAVRLSRQGRPGPVYLELMADIITSAIDEDRLKLPPPAPEPERPAAAPETIAAAVKALQSAGQSLVVIGKGAAYARAEDELRQFIETTQLPFLATPMAKGLLPDDHPLSVAAARTLALQNTDLIFLVGARLNWLMHFGLPPRFKPDLRVVQLDIHAEEIGTNVPAEVALVGDAKTIVGQLNAYLADHSWRYEAGSPWRRQLAKKIEENARLSNDLMQDDSVPMGYYRVMREIRDALPRDAMIVSEGASTMDIGRQVLNNYLPRHRLDAGTWGTMGVGPAFAIAAQVVDCGQRVVAVEGDSAFGFSAMEVEVACRHSLPVTFVVVNNNGIYGGPSELDPGNIPPGAYVPNAHYEKIIEAFGGLGFYAETPDELRRALRTALDSGRPSVVNVMIGSQAARPERQFAWHTR